MTPLNTKRIYSPMFLSWCESYEQEEQELRELILSRPTDIQQLKAEYQQLTGKQFRKCKGE